jgi:branched-chain amino acid transport system ATP-binding protein
VSRDPDTPLLQLDGVTKHYGSLAAVDSISLAVAGGERHALIGPNGAGKSTLFQIIAGETPASSGGVVFDGHDITHLPEHRRARLGLSRTFQQSNLFDGLSVFDNVAMAVQRRQGLARGFLRNARRHSGVTERSTELLERVGLPQRAGFPAGGLAHGERRRLEVAIALATEPTLLLMDEPSAGMSREESGVFRDMVGSLPGELTFIVVEHDMDLVFALATRISVLDAGRLIAQGGPAEIRRSPEVREVYLGRGKERQRR